MRFQLPADASPLTRRVAAFCQQRLRLPELLMVVLFAVRPWVWAAAAAWFAGAPLAHRLEVRQRPVLRPWVTPSAWTGGRQQGFARRLMGSCTCPARERSCRCTSV